jgi:hypothetical protein
MKKRGIFTELPPTFVLTAHFKDDEFEQLRKDLERHGAPITDSIFQAELVVTKLSQERRIKRDIQEAIRDSPLATTSSTKALAIVRERWVRKCLEEGNLVDYPFEDKTWRMAEFVALPPVTPPKRKRTPEPEFAVPGMPASKHRSLSYSDSKSEKASSQHRPSVTSAQSFESASSDDPTSKHYHPPSQTSTVGSEGEDEDLSNYMDVYSCRRRTPLISRNEDFIRILLEIKLARELALYLLIEHV